MVTINKLRVFNSSTELDYSDGLITKTDNNIVNKVKLSTKYNSGVLVGSNLTFKQSDGSTTVFSASVTRLNRESLSLIQALTNGAELNRLMIETNYTDKSPEYIVQDIIDNYTINLTYASSVASGVTLDKYIAKDYAITILTEMMNLLEWSLLIDENDNVYFQPKGYVNNGVVLTNGDNCTVKKYEEDREGIVNIAQVTGGFKSYSTQETVSGTGTDFVLSNKPNGSLKATVSGTIISPSDYSVDADNKTVSFDTSKTNPTFDYSYDRPIIVSATNDYSINKYNIESTKKFEAPFLNTISDVRAYASSLVGLYGLPVIHANVEITGYNFDIDVGEEVLFVDNVRGISRKLNIYKIEYDLRKGVTSVYLGSKEYTEIDWKRETKERIRKLERRYTQTDKTIISKNINNELDVELSVSNTFEYASPRNNFYLDHPTLSYPRTGYNDEPDCSGTGNYGTWSSDNNGGIIDDADSITGSWTATYAGHSTTINNTEYIEGVGSINFIKDATQSNFEATLSASSLDMSGSDMFYRVYFYVKDSTALAKISSLTIDLIDSASDSVRTAFTPVVGWNRFDFDIQNPDSESGTFDETDVSTIKIIVNTNNTTDTFAAGDLMVDYCSYGNIDGAQYNFSDVYYGGNDTNIKYPRLCNAIFSNNAKLTIPDDSTLEGQNYFGYYFRFKLRDVTGTIPIIHKWTGVASTSAYKIFIDNDYINISISDGTTIYNYASIYPLNLNENVWYTMSIYNGGGGMSVNFDGSVQYVLGTPFMSVNSSSGTDLIIGNDGINALKGELDEVFLDNSGALFTLPGVEVLNQNKFYVDSDVKLWLSFDNAVLGNVVSPKKSFT